VTGVSGRSRRERVKGRTWRGGRQAEPTSGRHAELIGGRHAEPIGRRHEEPIGRRHEELIGGRHEEPIGRRHEEPIGRRRAGRKALAVVLASLLTAAGFDLSAAAQTSTAPPSEGGLASPAAAPPAPARAAQTAPAPATGAEPSPGTAAEPSATPAALQPSPAPAGPEPSPAPAASEPSPTPTPAAAQPSPAPATAEPDPPAPTCADPEILGTSLRCFPRLLVHDAAAVLGAPAHWRGRQWAIFSAEVAGLFALSFADKHIHMGVLPRVGHSAGRLAQDVEPLGGAASFGVLGAFYVAGAATGSEKAKGVAIDGLIASAIASGVLSTGLKYAVGRSRPRAGQGTHHFRPFSGEVSFPSGHATQAFAVASVVATEYPSAWVQVAAYGPAALVGLARLRHDAHWASDVAAGALIGIGVGRAVARLDLPLRQGRSAYHLRVVPVVGPHEQGLMLAASFK
jgi:membrane-associated phospholipid phosphatase